MWWGLGWARMGVRACRGVGRRLVRLRGGEGVRVVWKRGNDGGMSQEFCIRSGVSFWLDCDLGMADWFGVGVRVTMFSQGRGGFLEKSLGSIILRSHTHLFKDRLNTLTHVEK